MNLCFNPKINYMSLLSVLELSIVLLRAHGFRVIKEFNPLTGEETMSSSDGSKCQKIFIDFIEFFLFTGEKGKLKPDSGLFRVSIKSNVITLLAVLAENSTFHKSSLHELKVKDQRFDEIFKFKNHEDQGLRCSIILLCSSLLSNSDFSSICSSILLNALRDSSAQVVCKTVQAISKSTLSCHSIFVNSFDLISELIRVSSDHSLYFATKVELISFFSKIEWRWLPLISKYQEESVFDFMVAMISSQDGRLRRPACEAAPNIFNQLFFPALRGKEENRIISKLNLELDSILDPSYAKCDSSMDYAVKYIFDRLLRTLTPHEIEGYSLALFNLYQTYPKVINCQKAI